MSNDFYRPVPRTNRWRDGRPIDAPVPVLQEIIKLQEKQILKLEAEVKRLRDERWRFMEKSEPRGRNNFPK